MAWRNRPVRNTCVDADRNAARRLATRQPGTTGRFMSFEERSLEGLVASYRSACPAQRIVTVSTSVCSIQGCSIQKIKSIARLLLVFVFTALTAHAQGVGSSGEITGTVTDSAGGVVIKATVNVVDTETGLKRTATTNSTGQFRVAGLSPATYDIRAEMPGFATEIRKSVAVAVGQTVISDFR